MTEDAAYFRSVAAALKEAGRLRPTLVIDLDRLDRNIQAARAARNPALAIRIVDKSLPSLPLLSRILQGLETRRIMSFDPPVTKAVLQAFPDVEVLYGKPIPTPAVDGLLRMGGPNSVRDVAAHVVFLADGAHRVSELSALAKSHGIVLRVALEVDVGMHRGGIDTPMALRQVVEVAHRLGSLIVEGVMAYEAHIPAIPGLFGGAAREAGQVRARLAAFVDALPAGSRRILNTGGSKTFLTYGDPGAANEASVGSAFVKPTDFGTPSLDALVPAAFIATPVLKIVDAALPGPRIMTSIMQTLGAFPRKGCFIYGGYWSARPVFPEGMRESRLWGHSSNQQFMALPNDCDLDVDDLVFFRPTQSEAILWQFGPIQLYSQGRITGEWPVIVP